MNITKLLIYHKSDYMKKVEQICKIISTFNEHYQTFYISQERVCEKVEKENIVN